MDTFAGQEVFLFFCAGPHFAEMALKRMRRAAILACCMAGGTEAFSGAGSGSLLKRGGGALCASGRTLAHSGLRTVSIPRAQNARRVSMTLSDSAER